MVCGCEKPLGERAVQSGVMVLILLVCGTASAVAGDWPQWRYGPGRGAATPDELPAELHLRWVRQLEPPRPAWPESQPWLRFDASYCPVAAGGRLFVPSMVTDSVTAYDAETGAEQWRFISDGPVRLAPIVDNGRVFFASDDGYLYCLTADEGRLLWRVRGGPSHRTVLGNGRLISTWPIRGGPVLLDGTVYFTAGIWPFMGIFVRAVDAETGEPIWTNSGDSCPYITQPHNSPAFSGFVPRGPLVATECGLIVPGGRTPPACYDLKTGRQLHWQWINKGGGTFRVTAHRQWYFAGGFLRRVADGNVLAPAMAMVHDTTAAYSLVADTLSAETLVPEEQTFQETDRKGRTTTATKTVLKPLWNVPVAESCGLLYLKAGSRLFAGKPLQVSALEVNAEAQTASIVWRATIEGSPWTMLAADDKLFVVTLEGQIYCFGAKQGEATTYEPPAIELGENHTFRAAGELDAARVLEACGANEGYALVFGLGSGRLAEELVCGSELHVIAIDPDESKVAAFRRRMIHAGLYGIRTAAHVGNPAEFALPLYLANLVVCGDAKAAGVDRPERLTAVLARVLRPYGGDACLPVDKERLSGLLQTGELVGCKLQALGAGATMLIRSGPLPGAADWTHQYGDAANTVVSQDDRVRAPLGLLWFGGPSNDEVLPRHGHGPAPQVAAGRLFIEGPDMLRALDIYTGRLLWQKTLPGLGKFYDNTSHQPGANEIGSNYVSLPDSVYVAYGDSIQRLDAATGELLARFRAPLTPGSPEPRWGYLGARGNVLVATSTPVTIRPDAAATAGGEPPTPPHKTRQHADGSDSSPDPSQAVEKNARGEEADKAAIGELFVPVDYASASRRLSVIDRHTGRVLWHREAVFSFRHNNIAVAADRVFVIDGLPPEQQQRIRRRGGDGGKFPSRLLALDLRTGNELWSRSEDVFGTFLNYSEQHDVLLQAGSAARDRARDETDTGMIAYRGCDGSVLWKALDRQHSGPSMLHGDTVITQGEAYCLLTGEPKMREHPLTGERAAWTFKRNYGCNTAIASRHLLTFRSAAAGLFDLARDGGTGNLGGFKSGCTSNLIVAGGLLNAPEYTRTCTCNYQNQTSLAMIHDPEAEMWTFNDLVWDGKPVRRVGINFGAPGDRRADDGTLWLDWPSVGGPSPDLPLTIEPEGAETFRHHSSLVARPPDGSGIAWVAASGLRGVRRVCLTLSRQPVAPRPYTVRLHFLEPDDAEPGRRVVDVRLQGGLVVAGLDITKEVGRMTALVREFGGVQIADTLEIQLAPAGDATLAEPILSGIHVVAESPSRDADDADR